MTNKEAIVWLKECKEHYGEYHEMCDEALDIAIKALEERPTDDLSEYSDKLWQKAYERGKAEARPQGEWIPVSVQEPDVGGIYLVTGKHVISGHIGIDIARRISDDVWTFGGEELPDTKIIAWQTLPKPFKEANNE